MRLSQYTFRNPFIKGSLKTLQTKTGPCRPAGLYFPFSSINLGRRWTDFVALVSASVQVLMAQGSFYSLGATPVDITSVRFARTAFHHITERIETRSTDVGASQMIIDGKIKLKNDTQISRFTEKGLEFEDGSTLDADAVVFATV
jgi:hypothetical protein